MNIAIRKLALLEKTINEKEEQARVTGYSTCPMVDENLKNRISELMYKIKLA